CTNNNLAPSSCSGLRYAPAATAGRLMVSKSNLKVGSPHGGRSGEPKKNKRVCRFCSRDIREGASFKNRAHVLPEAIGNKKIFSHEECDDCNQYFSSAIEQDFSDHAVMWRVLKGVKGKRGIPSLISKGAGYSITNEDRGAIFKGPDGQPVSPLSIKTIPICNERKINLTNVYRALVRAAIGIMPRSCLANIAKTIEWVRYSSSFGDTMELPPVAIGQSGRFCDQPVMTVYVNKVLDEQMPYIFADYFIGPFVFVIIIPSVNDQQDYFSCRDAYNHFWHNCKHYELFHGWEFLDWSADEKEDYNWTLKFN
ncbi:HNH endonuclease, partial [Kiloniella sp. b19]|uniref:HNH endonuclease n=1 Tax=Kiloniella sp. GXU_MW_B19 TaxID=3141326 RepID=UPI0031DD81F4